MATKKELYDHLYRLQEENQILKRENKDFRLSLMYIYDNVRSVLGIEAAIQAREDEKRKEDEKRNNMSNKPWRLTDDECRIDYQELK